MARDKKEPKPPPSTPAWLATYGDMVTLVLTFFVLLFSMSSINESQFQMLASALSSGLGILSTGSYMSDAMIDSSPDEENKYVEKAEDDIPNQIEPGGNPPIDLELDMESILEFQALASMISEYIEQQQLSEAVKMEATTEEIRFTFSGSALFASGSADLNPEMMPVLDDMAAMFISYSDEINVIDIVGHTDNLPINTPQFPSNWELSAMRAIRVLRYFREVVGLPEGIYITATGWGETVPVASNDTPEGRALNRRVEMTIRRMRLTSGLSDSTPSDDTESTRAADDATGNADEQDMDVSDNIEGEVDEQ